MTATSDCGPTSSLPFQFIGERRAERSVRGAALLPLTPCSAAAAQRPSPEADAWHDQDPLRNYRFRVEIDGIQAGGINGGTAPWDSARRPRARTRDVSRTVRVILIDRFQADVSRWTFAAAEPTAYSMSPLNALLSAPLIETLELSVGGFEGAFESVTREALMENERDFAPAPEESGRPRMI